MVRTTTKKRVSRTLKYSNKRMPFRGNLYRKNKRRISFSKLLKLSLITSTFVIILFAVLYGLFLYNKTNAESVNQNVVLKQLSSIINLPEDNNLISVKRISNAKELISQGDLYKNINLENGDYIIIYKDMLIIYNFDKNHIKKIQTNIKN